MSHKQATACSACRRAIHGLDAAIGDSLCGLCRADKWHNARLLAKVEQHCLRHAHPGTSAGYHAACRDVLAILRDDPMRPAHDPTPEQVREQCAEIRAGWPPQRLAENQLRVRAVETVVVATDQKGAPAA